MKQICHPDELLKALAAANLSQFIQNIVGENQKQLDGVILPICEIIRKDGLDQATHDAITIVWNQQLNRDWRAFVTQQATILAAQDADIRADNIADQVKAMDQAAYDAFWLGLTANQKDRILKRLFRAFCRNR